jgi:myotubularin-related protein 1/2
MEEEWNLLDCQDGETISVKALADDLRDHDEEHLDNGSAGGACGSASVYFSVLEENLQLLPGEQLDSKTPKVGPVVEVNSRTSGTLYISNYQIIFKPKIEQSPEDVIRVPLRLIDKMEISVDNSVTIQTKHFQHVPISFPTQDVLQQFVKRVNELNIGHSPENSFALQNQEDFGNRKQAWSIYDPQEEYFKRQKVDPALWRSTFVNEKFQVCRSYPRVFVVPASLSDQVLERAAKFRASGRLPVLCWLNPRTQAAICRSSQPMVGLTGHRNCDDEDVIRAISRANPNGNPIYIIDCRPWSSAVVNKARGAGVECAENYQNSKICFMNIDNIHTMRDSLRMLSEVVKSRADYRWLSSLDSTRWLEHLRLVLNGAVKIVSLVEREKSNVLVHCSDGWDRTAQLSCLAQLLLDPFYRTLRGFQVLIDKEWLSFGHKFADRCGHGKSMLSDQESSPVFLQFVDCVWQLTQQFQCFFEFNEHFLITLLDQLYSCRFGTFLCNTELERLKYRLRERTLSLWSYINASPTQYLNPLYRSHDGALFPLCSARHISFWALYYLRFQSKTPEMRSDEHIRESLRTELAARSYRLEKEIQELKKMLEQENTKRTELQVELDRAQQEKEKLRRHVNCALYRAEEGGEAELIAKIQTGADADIVSKFCSDLRSLKIIDDYTREVTPPPSPCLEEEGFLVVGQGPAEDGQHERAIGRSGSCGGSAPCGLPTASPSSLSQRALDEDVDGLVTWLEIQESDAEGRKQGSVRFPIRWSDYLKTVGYYMRNYGLPFGMSAPHTHAQA